MSKKIQGNIVDIPGKAIYFGELWVQGNTISRIVPLSENPNTAAPFICPGFIDAHVHIESSMLIPSSFARLAVVHGTVATISDPHEIANVLGAEGVHFMIQNGKETAFKFHFGAPSCVPATAFETAGDHIDADAVRTLLERNDIYYLSEMMNFPGVLQGDEEVMRKIAFAKSLQKPVDGHAPGLRGEAALKYIEAGISTDHECFTIEEAQEKLGYGMKILIREGSAAKNFEALIPLLHDHPDKIMFCSDDKHPDSLAEGHINQLCARAIAHEVDLFHVLQAACINPVLHYNMQVGLLREGDPADFIILEDLRKFSVRETWIEGQQVALNGVSKIGHTLTEPVNRFVADARKVTDFNLPVSAPPLPAIVALDGQLITRARELGPQDLLIRENSWQAHPANNILKLAVVNRYKPAPAAVCFISNFGLQTGAIASSVAHDSHNIIAVGADDESLCEAINLVIKEKGGISCTGPDVSAVLPLPVAGLMSTDDGYEVAAAYTKIDQMAKSLGATLSAPFMTLSFMALLVIPALKLSDKGLFDGENFRFLRQ